MKNNSPRDHLTSSNYLVIGSGRMARHISHYLRLMKHQSPHIIGHVQEWDRSQDPHSLIPKAENSHFILLAISDSQIQNFYKKHLEGLDAKIIHFSGALTIDGLISTHPLMTFGSELYDLQTYKKIHFCIQGIDSLKDVFPAFENTFSVLFSAQKSLYHSLCVLTGNVPMHIWELTYKEFEKLNIPRSAIDHYIQQVTFNFINSHLDAITGPMKRKDLITIEKNIKSLEGKALQKIYETIWETLNEHS